MATEYPQPNIHFQVDWGGTRIGFAEVSGLGMTVEVIAYREGASMEYTPTKMPGRVTYDDIVLKRGVFASDNEFFDWINTIQLNSVQRRDLTVSLLNESHEPVMVWKVKNAFPTRLEGPLLAASGNDVAIETLVLAHEGMVIQTP